jgi:hypothetical protein
MNGDQDILEGRVLSTVQGVGGGNLHQSTRDGAFETDGYV